MNNTHTALIVTSISGPSEILRALADGCNRSGLDFILIGDEKSPAGFSLEGCDFYGLDRQYATRFETARLCPTRHYARKNLGYLLAAERGCQVIVETDDDNIPYDTFWEIGEREQTVPVVADGGWVNVYRYFTDENIWPRGLPLDRIQTPPPPFDYLPTKPADCPIQQGLVNDNPDTDAIYRLAFPLPREFRDGRRVALGAGAWCPFNSQNTVWWRDAFALMYLPAYCSFRMTDIWRSFVAQRIAWVNGWSVLFREPNIRQERNEHNLMVDFRDEVPGYLNNAVICEALEKLSLPAGVEHIAANLFLCYETLVELGIMPGEELPLVQAWIDDLAMVS